MAKLRARIASREKIADATYAFRIEPDGPPFSYKAGQTLDLTLPELTHLDEAGNRRTFSIANAPGYGGLLVATRARGSGLKLGLVEAPLGSEIVVDGPYGNFTLPNKRSDVVMLAGGIGVTPFRAMAEDVLERSLDHTLTLIHSNRTPEEAPFLEELMRWGVEASREMERASGSRSEGHRADPHAPGPSPTAQFPGAHESEASGEGRTAARPPLPDKAPGEPGVSGSPYHPGISGSHYSESAHGVLRRDTPALGEAPSGPSTLAAPGRPHFVYLPTMTRPERSARGWKGESRRVSPELLADILPANRNEPIYYVAGPPRFVAGTIECLKAVGVDEDRIRHEEFAGY